MPRASACGGVVVFIKDFGVEKWRCCATKLGDLIGSYWIPWVSEFFTASPVKPDMLMHLKQGCDMVYWTITLRFEEQADRWSGENIGSCIVATCCGKPGIECFHVQWIDRDIKRITDIRSKKEFAHPGIQWCFFLCVWHLCYTHTSRK